MPKAGRREIDADFDTFEFRALVVEPPHHAGRLPVSNDVSGLDHPLEGAKLHLRTLRDADGTELFDFEIPFDKYLQVEIQPDELSGAAAGKIAGRTPTRSK